MIRKICAVSKNMSKEFTSRSLRLVTQIIRYVGLSAVLFLFSGASWSMTAIELLNMLDDARSKHSFVGTFIHSRGDAISTYEIVHMSKHGSMHERLKSLDGAPREILRDGDSVTCIHPEDQGSRWDEIPPLSPLVPNGATDWQALTKVFQFDIVANRRLAGREASVVELQPIHQDRYLRRYWVDQKTGLLLKTEIVAANGRVLEMAQFSEVSIDPDNIEQEIKPTLQGIVKKFTRQQHWLVPENDMNDWAPSWLPEGFVKTGSKSGQNDQSFLEAYTYSDGLSSFSLFREPSDHGFIEMEGQSSGATVAVARIVKVKEGQSWGITLVGEVPVSIAKRITQSVKLIPQ